MSLYSLPNMKFVEAPGPTSVFCTAIDLHPRLMLTLNRSRSCASCFIRNHLSDYKELLVHSSYLLHSKTPHKQTRSLPTWTFAKFDPVRLQPPTEPPRFPLSLFLQLPLVNIGVRLEVSCFSAMLTFTSATSTSILYVIPLFCIPPNSSSVHRSPL
jgi:hypothetical protein